MPNWKETGVKVYHMFIHYLLSSIHYTSMWSNSPPPNVPTRAVLHWWNSAVRHVIIMRHIWTYVSLGGIILQCHHQIRVRPPHLKVSALEGEAAGVPPIKLARCFFLDLWNSGYWNILISIVFFYLMSEVLTLVELPGVVVQCEKNLHDGSCGLDLHNFLWPWCINNIF